MFEELDWEDTSWGTTCDWKQDDYKHHYGKNGFYLDQNFFAEKYNPHKKLYVITYTNCDDVIGRREYLYHCTNKIETLIQDILEINPSKTIPKSYDFSNVIIHICDRRGHSQGLLYIPFTNCLELSSINKKNIKIYAKNKYYRNKTKQLLTDIMLTIKLIA
jgi:hypothetical protein